MSFVPGQRPVAPWRFHNWWGIFSAVAELPNCAAFTDTGYTNDVQRGDLAWADDAGGLYVCTDPTPGAAVWVSLATGGTTGGSTAVRWHLPSGVDITVLPDFQYLVEGPFVIDAGASLTLDGPDARLAVI